MGPVQKCSAPGGRGLCRQEQVVDQGREARQDPRLHLLLHHRAGVSHGGQDIDVLHDQADQSELEQHPILQRGQERNAIHRGHNRKRLGGGFQ